MSRTRSLPASAAAGGVLIEFALVALVFYLLLAAVVTFGSMVHTAQVTQDVARLAARELALTPLPAGTTFDQALLDPTVQARIYDPGLLVIDLDEVESLGLTIDQFFAAAPIVNRALRPIYIFENVGNLRLLRVPGALLGAPTPTDLNAGLTVGVPLVRRGVGGAETIRWAQVLEEVRFDPLDPLTGPFSVLSTGPDRGLVALRINVPDQSSVMSSFAPSAAGPFESNLGNVQIADDTAVIVDPTSPPAPGVVDPTIHPAVPGLPGTYSGTYGLGVQGAFASEVRPFRRVFSGQALYRREVFSQ